MILTILSTCSYNVSYNTSLLLEEVWRGYNQAPEKYSAMNIEIGISRNTKCAIWNGFQDPVTYVMIYHNLLVPIIIPNLGNKAYPMDYLSYFVTYIATNVPLEIKHVDELWE